jgi:uncharacterized protein YwqG
MVAQRDRAAYQREVDELIAASPLARLRDQLLPLIAPSIRLRTRTSLAADWEPGARRTHLGGQPELPHDFVWPTGAAGPLAFLAQIDLVEVAPFDVAGLLPSTGTLSFLGQAEDLLVCDWQADGWRVHYWPPETDLAPRAPPDDLSSEADFGHIELQPELEPTLRDISYEALLDLVGQEWRPYHDLRAALADRHGGYQQVHRMLGNAWPAQNDPLRLPGLVLLLQIDSEFAAGMEWGDVGGLYFSMRESDLAERRFERVGFEAQCH